MNIFIFRRIFEGVSLLLFALIFAGCGSGVAGQNNSNVVTTSKVSLKTSQLLPAGTVFGALELTLHFPQGITVPLDSKTGEPAPDVAKLTGATNAAMTFTKVKYTPATASTDGTLKFQIYDTNGFNSNGNEYIDLQVNALPGFKSKSTDFTLSDFTVSDLNGIVSTQSLPSLTLDII